MHRVKGLAMLSGGLDSMLAIRLILDQGLEVEAINFETPFCLCRKGGCGAYEAADGFDIPLKIVNLGKEFLNVVRKPKHGYGKNMNPCIDCRILMFKKAKKYAKQVEASFIFTGEVLAERPMSQHLKAFEIIEKEAGLEGKILRPLSAKLLLKTEAEKKGWVNREKLLDVQGRSRKRQIRLAQNYGMKDYPCPAGGCLLTYKQFADKVKDLFEHKKRVSLGDIQLLKVGRHFRYLQNKIIVGRNESENRTLVDLKMKNDYYFEVQEYMGPITLLQGRKTRKAIRKAACLTAHYSDKKTGKVLVKFGKKGLNESIFVPVLNQDEIGQIKHLK